MMLITTPKSVFLFLLWIIMYLFILNVIAILCKDFFDLYDFIVVKIIYNLFSFNVEKNFPTVYSAIALLISSGLLFIIAIKHRHSRSGSMAWFGLMFVFLFLSYDEIFMIHEKISFVLRQSFKLSGVFHYAWVIPYSVIVVVLLLLYLRFLFKLPPKTRNLFIVSGAIFVSGAIGFELIGGWQYEKFGEDLLYAVFYTIEELLEMLGIAVFIYTLLQYVDEQFGDFTVSIKIKAD